MGQAARASRSEGHGPEPASKIRARWSSALAVAVLLGSPHASASAEEALATTPPTTAFEEVTRLLPGQPVERVCEAGMVHRYVLPEAEGLLRLVALQRDSDVALSLFDAAGEMLARVDDLPADHPGAEIAVIDAGGHTHATTLEVVASRRGTYRLDLELHPHFDVGTGPAESSRDGARRRLAADRFATTAATLRAGGAEAERRDAIALYRRAAEQLTAPEDVGRRALMVQSQATLETDLGDTDQALADLDLALSLWRSANDRAGEASALLMRGVTHSRRGDEERAREDAERAAELFHGLGLLCGEARAANNLGRLEGGASPERARELFGKALELCGDGREPELESVLLLNMGGLHARLGELDLAIELSHRALPVLRSLDQSWMVMRTLVNLGYYHRRLGQLGRSFERYGEALTLAEHHGDRHLAGTVNNSLGYLYLLLGEADNAFAHLEAALDLRREVEDLRGEAVTLANLARTHRLRGELELARRRLDESLALRRRRGDHRGEARALRALAELDLESNDPGAALGHLDIAIALTAELDDPALTRDLALTRARALLSADRIEPAIELLRTELGQREKEGHALALVEVLPVLARAERLAGRHTRALERLTQARGWAEDLRLEIGDPELRASFFGSIAAITEEEIATRLELHQLEPDADHAERAFEASERGRARGLFELLAEAEAGLRLDADPALLARRDRLLREAGARAAQRRRTANESDHAKRLDREIAERVAALRGVEETLRRQSPRWRSLDPAALPSTTEISALLDPETVVIEIVLGEIRSVLFVLGHDRFELFELPSRVTIEEAARRLLELWSVLDPYPQTAERLAGQLSDLILAPIAALLEGRERLVVVADGALHTLPFAALPMPGSGNPLLEHFEVVTLPSASWLILRGQHEPRTTPTQVAVIADPVFSALDPRLPRPSDDSPNRDQASGQVGDHPLAPRGSPPPRLPSSGREARSIAALAGDDTLTLLGTEARLEALFDDTLDDRRVLHLATHGVLDGRHPRLSGLELSRFDAEGRPVEGFLSLARLYDLRLDADLVVLSGCRTALGRTVRGEGLIGLPRGFLHAGARSVVASLWQIQDRATAGLMEHFYRALLEDGMRPSAALRHAQLTLRSEPSTHDPFHWAAFVHVGDWR